MSYLFIVLPKIYFQIHFIKKYFELFYSILRFLYAEVYYFKWKTIFRLNVYFSKGSCESGKLHHFYI